MTGKTRKVRAAVAAVLSAGVLGAVGCAGGPGLQQRFQDVNNNNGWPERNGYLARHSVLHPFEVQQNNAAVVNDVILNTMFESGSDKLNSVGKEKLDQLVRRMPAPNPTVYVQLSNDVAYDDKAPEKTVLARTELDQKRQAAVLAYMNARPSRGVAYSAQVVDMGDPSFNSTNPAAAVRGLTQQYKSGITGSISGGNPVGAGGGLASSTVGVVPTATGPQQGQGGGAGVPTGGGGGGGGTGGR